MFKSGWGHVLVYAALIGAGAFLISRYQKKKAAEKASAKAAADAAVASSLPQYTSNAYV